VIDRQKGARRLPPAHSPDGKRPWGSRSSNSGVGIAEETSFRFGFVLSIRRCRRTVTTKPRHGRSPWTFEPHIFTCQRARYLTWTVRQMSRSVHVWLRFSAGTRMSAPVNRADWFEFGRR